MDISEWVKSNLSNLKYFTIYNYDWDFIFGYVIWNLWLLCNAIMFDNSLEDNDSILEKSFQHKKLTCHVRPARQVMSIDGNSSNYPTLWWCPPPNWHKINTDGSRVLTDGRALCGGVTRDHLGRWRLRFHKFIGVCSIVEAKQ
ncbi:hypothetical protein V6N12_043070 [Hibiscus sabdariffa]|uniref:RNase H type-1 domain-containing protein n=1 Tax=Hibiscus sabdariffa TaxID=183260 RepID=A0ABR2DI49_9ROSI